MSLELNVVGLNFRVTPATQRQIAKSLPRNAKLEREPKNAHDENAIKVILDDNGKDWHIGYIQRETASVLAPTMDDGSFSFERGRLVGLDAEKGTATLVLYKAARRRKRPKGPGNKPNSRAA